MPRPALRPLPPRHRARRCAPTSRQTPVPDAARVPKRASARCATCRGPPVPTPCASRSAPMPRNLSFLATKPRSGAKTVGAFATIRRRPGVSLAKASTSVEIGGKTLPECARTRFRGQKSPLLLHGATQKPPTATPPGIEASARGEKGQGRRRRAPSHRGRRMRQRRHITTRVRVRAITTRAPDGTPRAAPLAPRAFAEKAKGNRTRRRRKANEWMPHAKHPSRQASGTPPTRRAAARVIMRARPAARKKDATRRNNEQARSVRCGPAVALGTKRPSAPTPPNAARGGRGGPSRLRGR